MLEKWHAEIDAKKCYFSKGAKNQKNRSKVRFWIETGPKAFARVVGLRRLGSPKAAPKYAHATKEEKGPAERKKKQERKKGYVVTRVQEGSEHARGQRPGEFCDVSCKDYSHMAAVWPTTYTKTIRRASGRLRVQIPLSPFSTYPFFLSCFLFLSAGPFLLLTRARTWGYKQEP